MHIFVGIASHRSACLSVGKKGKWKTKRFFWYSNSSLHCVTITIAFRFVIIMCMLSSRVIYYFILLTVCRYGIPIHAVHVHTCTQSTCISSVDFVLWTLYVFTTDGEMEECRPCVLCATHTLIELFCINFGYSFPWHMRTQRTGSFVRHLYVHLIRTNTTLGYLPYAVLIFSLCCFRFVPSIQVASK